MSLLQVCVWDQCGVIYKIQLLQGFLFCLIRTISFLEFLCTNSLCAFIRKGKVEFRMKGRKNFFVVSVYLLRKRTQLSSILCVVLLKSSLFSVCILELKTKLFSSLFSFANFWLFDRLFVSFETFFRHYSKSQIFVQKFNFDKTPTF